MISSFPRKLFLTAVHGISIIFQYQKPQCFRIFGKLCRDYIYTNSGKYKQFDAKKRPENSSMIGQCWQNSSMIGQFWQLDVLLNIYE